MEEPCVEIVAPGDDDPDSGEVGENCCAENLLSSGGPPREEPPIDMKFSYSVVIMAGSVIGSWTGDDDGRDSSVVEKGDEIESISDELSDIISEINDSISEGDWKVFDSEFNDDPISAAEFSIAAWKSPERKSNVTDEEDEGASWDGFGAPNPTPSTSKSPKRSRKAMEFVRWKETDIFGLFYFRV